MPANILDLYAEHRCATNGLPTLCGDGLIGALAQHGKKITGDVTFVQVYLGTALFIVSLDPSVQIRPDEPVFVEFDQDRIHLFDGETQNALRAA